MRVRFRGFILDTDRRELSSERGIVPLTPKAFDLLAALASARPRAVSQQDLYDQLWPDTHVDPGNLHKLIHQVREALDDRDRQIVKTAYGFGFAFGVPASDDAGQRPARWQLVIGDREFELKEGENIVGREREAEVRIESTSISRRHARLVVAAGAVTLEDLGSKNGTMVEGRRIRHVVLEGGEQILFGTVAARLELLRSEPSTETVA